MRKNIFEMTVGFNSADGKTFTAERKIFEMFVKIE